MSKLRTLISFVPFRYWLYLALAVVLFVVICVAVCRCENDNSLSVVSNDKIELTPNQIQQIEAIGEWEFLAIDDEELVDTVKYGFFGDDKLVRIYFGTLRLGVNLREARPRWLSMQGDTLCATLPPVKLLDDDFIDEARTKSFFSTGTWSDADRDHLYYKANAMMRKRCLTPTNMALAEENARAQFTNLLRSLGFDKTKVVFDEAKTTAKKER
jgi:hypothetical protein